MPDPEKKATSMTSSNRIMARKIATLVDWIDAASQVAVNQITEIAASKSRCFQYLVVKNVNCYQSLCVN